MMKVKRVQTSKAQKWKRKIKKVPMIKLTKLISRSNKLITKLSTRLNKEVILMLEPMLTKLL